VRIAPGSMLYILRDGNMAKFDRNEDGEYVCPACKREYEKYNSIFQHYKLKHGNSETVDKVDRAEKSITTKIKEIPETVANKIVGSNSNNDIDDDDNQSSEIVNNTTVSIAPKKTIKRVHLKPVEPSVKKTDKKPQKARDIEKENDKETETETWIIPGIIKGSLKNKRKVSEEDS
jgi:hypothetical protein